ncbi:hypothetical protein LWI29_033106 [Acer saccharum]|uniref:Uncharacterized protein n=1 Tax=Acer saccharum TaxID=4024 RepID=A0AA39SXK9_ACESA|nr:hypothetical protein LWI29_033106 [Acer saccharum]
MWNKKFEVKLVEEESPVDMVWLENFLELRKNQDQGSMESWLDKERFQTSLPTEVGEIDTSSNPKEGRVVVYKELSCQSRKAELTAKQGQLGIGKEKRGKWERKSIVIQNGKLDLEKRRSIDKGVVSSSEKSHWSLEKEIGVHIFPNSHKVKGDFSKMSGVGRPKFGRHIIRPKKVSFKLGSLNRRQAQSSIEQLDLCVDLGSVEVRPPTRDPIQGITGSGSKGGALVSNIKEVEISSGKVRGSADACVSSYSRRIKEDMVKATVVATKDQMVNASIAADKAHVEKNVDVERAEMDDWVPTSNEMEKEVAATRLSKKKAVDSVEEDASTVITQVQVGLGVEELSTETICHE